MKVNTNSWHYNVLVFFKWARKGSGYSSFSEFKDMMMTTGRYQPIDFCAYWRNVLLYPGIFVLWWIGHISLWVYFLSMVELGNVAKAGGFAGLVIGGVAFLIWVLFSFCYLFSKYLESRKKKGKKGFFSAVNEALKNPEVCTIMEYETNDD